MRVGIDLGGTKIAAVALGGDGTELARHRRPTPRDYDATLNALAETVAALDPQGSGGIGISLPGNGEAPAAPVFIDGEKAMTLRGEGIAKEFQQIVESYVQRRWGGAQA